MVRSMLRSVALLATVALSWAAADARAAFVGSFGLNANQPVAMPTNSLATATSFSFANLVTNGNASGGFAASLSGNFSTFFTTTTLTLGSMTGFTFSNSSAGTFTQTAAAVMTSMSNVGGTITSETFLISGNYSGGVVGTTATPSSFTISFTQVGGPGTSVSASGTLDIPPVNAVPEPASVAMLGLGLMVVGGVAQRRRLRAA